MGTRQLLGAVALTAIAACASDADPVATDAPSTTPATTITPSTTEAASTTTTTEVATTTLARTTTAAPTTTLAPTTTVDPLVQLAAEIERDLNLGEQALLAAVGDPSNDELRSALEAYYRPDLASQLFATLDSLVEEGLLGRPNAAVPSRVRVRDVIEVPNDTRTEPTIVELCRVDAGVIYEPLDGGGEIIVNDRVRVVETISRVFMFDGTWVLDGGELLEELGASADCES